MRGYRGGIDAVLLQNKVQLLIPARHSSEFETAQFPSSPGTLQKVELLWGNTHGMPVSQKAASHSRCAWEMERVHALPMLMAAASWWLLLVRMRHADGIDDRYCIPWVLEHPRKQQVKAPTCSGSWGAQGWFRGCMGALRP